MKIIDEIKYDPIQHMFFAIFGMFFLFIGGCLVYAAISIVLIFGLTGLIITMTVIMMIPIAYFLGRMLFDSW